ncbi:MAG: helix-turn-helix domain-containing protein [Planctomycetes bacterium]|nr:helix-turn-helix domain-containing protein [Planctomycetota bacterium]
MKAATTETLGQRLARLRAAANMTQDELADKASVAVASMRNWEQDHRRPRADAALRLARALSVTMEELLVLPSSRPSRSDLQDPPGVRALKRAWARAKEGERQEFLKFVKQEGANTRQAEGAVASKARSSRDELKKKSGKKGK